MSYSLDFRKQVFKIKEQETLSLKAVSERFGISVRTLFRWKSPRPRATKIDKKTCGRLSWCLLLRYSESVPMVFCTLWDGLRSAVKKTLFHPKADEKLRERFNDQLFFYENVEQRSVVYIDESGFFLGIPATAQQGQDVMQVKIGTVRAEWMRLERFMILRCWMFACLMEISIRTFSING